MTQTLTVRRIATAIMVVFMTMLAALMLWPSAASGTTFTVMNNADSGAGSLRAAITSANAFVGQRDTIDFDPSAFPSGAPATISVLSALPASADPAGIVIDGSGAGVIIDGGGLAGAENGIVIQSGAGTDLSDIVVRNITVQNFPGHGVYVCGGAPPGCASGLSDTLIDDVTSSGHGGNAFFLDAQSNTRSIVMNSIASASNYGIVLSGSADLVDALVEDTQLVGNVDHGVDFDGDNLTRATVSGVTASNNGSVSINIAADTDNVEPRVTDTTVTTGGAFGIDIYAAHDIIDAFVSNVSIDGGSYGIDVFANNDATGARILNSEANGAINSGIEVYAVQGSVTDTIIDGCTANDTTDTGVNVYAKSGISEIEVTDCTASGNGSGVRLETDGDIQNATISDVDIENNSVGGINVHGDNVIATTVSGVAASNNGGPTINVAADTDNVNPSITDTTVLGADGFGLDVYAGNDLIDAIVSNVATDGGSYGIDLFGSNNTTGATILNSQATGAQSIGIDVDASNGMVVDATIDGCTANNNPGTGVNVYAKGGISGLQVANCTTSNNSIGVLVEGVGDVTDSTLTNVTASGNTDTGIVVQSTMGENNGTTITSSDVGSNNYGVIIEAIAGGQDTVNPLVSNSMIHDNNTGILIAGAGTVLGAEITSNTIANNTSAGLFSEGGEAHFNRIVGNNPGIDNQALGPLQAQNNWWGCNEGPGMPGCDSTSGIGGVDADPWLVLGIDASPISIPAGGMSVLTADVTMNSDGADTSGSGHIPNGTEIGFQTDLGSVGSKATVKNTTNGSAEATLSADEGPGTAHVTAILDNETVGVSVTITDVPETPTPTSTPGPNPTPTPTPPPAGELVQGDNDCDGDSDAVDGLKGLQHVAAIPFQQADGCPDVGGALPAAAPAGEPPDVFGDVDCDGDVDAVDALKILQSVAAIPFTQNEPCTDIGDAF